MKFTITKFRFLALFATVLSMLMLSEAAPAQTGHDTSLKFDKTVHNFGKISVQSGPQNCTFEYINVSDKPVVIYNILSSCGCTKPKWSKEPIMPGKGGTISVTYLNDQGPYPFDKLLTIYTSGDKRPILLRITGIAYENEKSIQHMFRSKMGMLNVMRNNISIGQIEQGNYKTGGLSVANLTSKDVTLTFTGLSKGLSLESSPRTIKAGEIGQVDILVDTREEKNWGTTTYNGYFVCNGIKADVPLKIETFIIDNLSKLSSDPENGMAMIMANKSSIDLGQVTKGKVVEALFVLRNTGQSRLLIHKVENNGKDFEIITPKSIEAGKEFTLKARIDTGKFQGKEIFTITLITNVHSRPFMNLFVTADIQ